MKRKVLSIILALCLVITSIQLNPITSSAAATNETVQIGDTKYGFCLKETQYDDATKTTKMLFIHKKTGAKMLVMKNSDTNRGFMVKFNTPADNDKGINHIIEHSVLGGSDKYPSNNIIFDVSNTTYLTFVNAFTAQNTTSFPVASESEKQLMKLTDIYMDAVYHPLFLKDKKVFKREGIRYDLENKSANLTANGIVYNEMKGNASNMDSIAMENGSRAIFGKGNTQGYNSGGVPEEIQKLTYEEFVKTYKKNYHPSNSIMFLYGDVDYVPFLKMINDNYLSHYSKKKIKIDRDTVKPAKKLVQKNYSFPVAKGTETKNKSYIDLCYGTEDVKKLGFDNWSTLVFAISLLEREDSPLKKALSQSKIAESYHVNIDPSTYQTTIHFRAENADPSKKMKFYQIVQKELKNIVKNGFDSGLVQSSLSTQRFSKALAADGNVGINQMITAATYDCLFGDCFLDDLKVFSAVEKQINHRGIEKAIQKNMLDNKLVALTVTTPKAGLLEKNNKKLVRDLAKKKAAMTKKQINALVKETKEFKEWGEKSTPENVIKSLSVVSAKELPSQLKSYNLKESKVDGVSLTTAKADIGDVGSVQMIFDLSSLTMEELLYFKFYTTMMNSGMATKDRTENQVAMERMSTTYQFNTYMSALYNSAAMNTGHPVLCAQCYGFKEEYKDVLSLASDILMNSDISKLQIYGPRAIAQEKTDIQTNLSEPLLLAQYRALARTDQVMRYINYFNGLDYYKFISKLEKEINEHPKDVIQKLQDIRTKVFNKSNLKVYFAGDESGQQAFGKELSGFVKKLGDKTYEKANCTLPVPEKREALQTNGTVQYVVTNSSLIANGIEQSGKASVASILLNNLLLIPEIRLRSGAYGAGCQFASDSYVAYSFRDSKYVNTLNVIEQTDEFLANIDKQVSEEMLESYILNAFAMNKPAMGELAGATNELAYKMNGMSHEERERTLAEIKNTTLADIKEYASKLQRLNATENYVVAAPKSEIEAHRELFDVVIPLEF